MDGLALIESARKARLNAYAPYSNFMVGAALLTQDGQVFTGCNVENASYGLTLCAERNAITTAVANGVRDFTAIAIVGNGTEPALPCGACLQVMAEFSKDLRVYIGSAEGGRIIDTTLAELLPMQFQL